MLAAVVWSFHVQHPPPARHAACAPDHQRERQSGQNREKYAFASTRKQLLGYLQVVATGPSEQPARHNTI